MNITPIASDVKETFDSVVDFSCLSNGDEFEGLAFVKRVENGKVNSERYVSRFYLIGKFNLITQANFYLQDKSYFSSEDALKLKNKVVYIKGITGVYGNNHVILDLTTIQEFKCDLSSEDFLVKSPELDKYKNLLKTLIDDINQNYETLNKLNKHKCVSTLQKFCTFKDGEYVGDRLIATTRVIQDFITPREKAWRAAYLAVILATEMAQYELANQENTAKEMSLLNSNAHKIYDIFESIKIEYPSLSSTEKDELFHTMDVIYNNIAPQTHFSKVFTSGLQYYTGLAISRNFENSTAMICTGRHIKMR